MLLNCLKDVLRKSILCFVFGHLLFEKWSGSNFCVFMSDLPFWTVKMFKIWLYTYNRRFQKPSYDDFLENRVWRKNVCVKGLKSISYLYTWCVYFCVEYRKRRKLFLTRNIPFVEKFKNSRHKNFFLLKQDFINHRGVYRFSTKNAKIRNNEDDQT